MLCWWELVNKSFIINWFPSTFSPTLSHNEQYRHNINKATWKDKYKNMQEKTSLFFMMTQDMCVCVISSETLISTIYENDTQMNQFDVCFSFFSIWLNSFYVIGDNEYHVMFLCNWRQWIWRSFDIRYARGVMAVVVGNEYGARDQI